MTIEQISGELKVTKQAIFNRISRAGMKMEDLSSGKNGKSWILTEQGCEKIREMMRGASKKKQQKSDDETARNIAELQTELEKQRERANQNQELYKTAQQTIKAQADIMATQVKTLQTQATMLQQHTKAIEALNNSIQAQAITLAAQTRMIADLQEKTKRLAVVQVTGEEEKQKTTQNKKGIVGKLCAMFKRKGQKE